MNTWQKRDKAAEKERIALQNQSSQIPIGVTLSIRVTGTDKVQVSPNGVRLEEAVRAVLATMERQGLQPADLLAVGAAVLELGARSCDHSGVPPIAREAFAGAGGRVGVAIAQELINAAEAAQAGASASRGGLTQ